MQNLIFAKLNAFQKLDEDCKEFFSTNLVSAIQSLEDTKVKT